MAKAEQKKSTYKKPTLAQDKLEAVGIDSICNQISECVFYEDIAKSAGVSRHALIDWLENSHKDMYAQAKWHRHNRLAEDTIKISDEVIGNPVLVDGVLLMIDGKPVTVVDAASVQHARLKVDTRKWLVSKMLPKVYGDKLDIEHSGNVGIGDALTKALQGL